MLEVLNVEIKVNQCRLGNVYVRYHDLLIACEVCLYKEEKLWIRMPEVWITKEQKKPYVRWVDKKNSDKFQELILSKVFDMVGLTLEDAIKMKNEFNSKRKSLTTGKNKITFDKKNSEK